jgi:hypothetical protein
MISETDSQENITFVSTLPPSTNGKVHWIGKPLNPKQILAAQLVAEVKLALKQIASQVQCSVPSIVGWKHLPKFQEAVAHHRQVFQNRVAGSFLGQRMKRVKLRDQLAKSLIHVAKKRAIAAKKDKALLTAGGDNGLVISRERHVRGRGVVREFENDHATIDQLRNLMREQAIDVGQWAEKKDVAGSVELVVKRVIGVSEDDI